MEFKYIIIGRYLVPIWYLYYSHFHLHIHPGWPVSRDLVAMTSSIIIIIIILIVIILLQFLPFAAGACFGSVRRTRPTQKRSRRIRQWSFTSGLPGQWARKVFGVSSLPPYIIQHCVALVGWHLWDAIVNYVPIVKRSQSPPPLRLISPYFPRTSLSRRRWLKSREFPVSVGGRQNVYVC